ncbi:hypothetical protein SXCC_00074 [Gluconacetobacter sp. SXCC-1]|nr:hypothetical protein SXCC_00074 [Gluconacetobacter sp. SXCC-1]
MQFSRIRRARHSLQHCRAQDGMRISAIHTVHMQANTLLDCHAYAFCPIICPGGRHHQEENTGYIQTALPYPSHNKRLFPVIHKISAIKAMTFYR